MEEVRLEVEKLAWATASPVLLSRDANQNRTRQKNTKTHGLHLQRGRASLPTFLSIQESRSLSPRAKKE